MQEVMIPINLHGENVMLKITIEANKVTEHNENAHPLFSNTLKGILKNVSVAASIPVSVLEGKSRNHEVVYARFVYCQLAKIYTFKSLDEIGGYLNRHHTTVMHALDEFNYKKEQKYPLLMIYIEYLKPIYPLL